MYLFCNLYCCPFCCCCCCCRCCCCCCCRCCLALESEVKKHKLLSIGISCISWWPRRRRTMWISMGRGTFFRFFKFLPFWRCLYTVWFSGMGDKGGKKCKVDWKRRWRVRVCFCSVYKACCIWVFLSYWHGFLSISSLPLFPYMWIPQGDVEGGRVEKMYFFSSSFSSRTSLDWADCLINFPLFVPFQQTCNLCFLASFMLCLSCFPLSIALDCFSVPYHKWKSPVWWSFRRRQRSSEI